MFTKLSLLKKTILGIGTLAVIGGVGSGIYYLVSNKEEEETRMESESLKTT